jgi:protein-L-isoaspartate(D-aspartate) O-methyltransferase
MDKQSLIEVLKLEGITSPEVLKAIEKVPREVFVTEEYQHQAYENHPLPIGYEQTISQPYIVAQMTEIILTKNTQKVLEIGTGSGYQAAILSQLVKKVYTIERIQPLLDQAKIKFKKLNYSNIYTHYGDGFDGWAIHAPYDAIIVTAAAPEVPAALLDQLSDQGGRLLVPVGQAYGGQQLQLFIKQGKTYVTKTFEPVIFVPMLTGTIDK